MSVLVAYASKHGATEGIGRFIAEQLRTLGWDAVARSVEDVDDLADVEAVILGSAIYFGSWRQEAMEFVDRHAEALASLPVWVFSSGPLGMQAEDAETQPRQLAGLRDRLHPRDHRVFFGALDRSKLGLAERMMVKAVKAPEGDFRDWDEIRGWTNGILRHLPMHLV